MCGGGGPAPEPTVDPAAERQKAADEAAKAANAATAATALRKRGQAGLLSGEQGDSVLAQAFGRGVGRGVVESGAFSSVLGKSYKQQSGG